MIEYIKCSCVLIFNDKEELALQLRAAHDDSFPSHWDFGAGGGIDEGEEEKHAAEREIREELGVDASVEFVIRETVPYPLWNSVVMGEADAWIYKSHHNGPFNPDPNEVERVGYFSLKTTQQMIDAEKKIHPVFVEVWKRGIIAKIFAKQGLL